MKILVTGCAGFIGFHLCQALQKHGHQIVGVDNFNHYYDHKLKHARVKQLQSPQFQLTQMDISDRQAVTQLFQQPFDIVVHLAAQAGVRYSLDNPNAYIDSNLVGFANILEGCRHQQQLKHLLFASSSSVYGANTVYPFDENQCVDHPLSLYAATKKANELMAHSYAHLYNIACTGLRFFTVYGPWGRPDMAYYKFTEKIHRDEPIDVFDHGELWRDFTYIDDAVEAVMALLQPAAKADDTWSSTCPKPATSFAPYRIVNIGNHQPVQVKQLIEIIEKHLNKKAIQIHQPMPCSDVTKTYANIDYLTLLTGKQPTTSLAQGMLHFLQWYQNYHAKFSLI